MACLCLPHRDSLVLAVNRGDFCADVNVNVEAILQRTRCLQNQGGAVRDDPTDVVRKPTVRKGDFAAPFKHGDLGALA